jgi:hypothetical protein
MAACAAEASACLLVLLLSLSIPRPAHLYSPTSRITSPPSPLRPTQPPHRPYQQPPGHYVPQLALEVITYNLCLDDDRRTEATGSGGSEGVDRNGGRNNVDCSTLPVRRGDRTHYLNLEGLTLGNPWTDPLLVRRWF